MHAVSRAVPHHSCRPLAILIELHRHAAVHDEPPRANLVADPELAATLQPITLLREPGPRLEAQRHNTFDSLADQRANDFVFRCQEPALVHGRANRHRVGQRELGVRRAEESLQHRTFINVAATRGERTFRTQRERTTSVIEQR